MDTLVGKKYCRAVDGRTYEIVRHDLNRGRVEMHDGSTGQRLNIDVQQLGIMWEPVK